MLSITQKKTCTLENVKTFKIFLNVSTCILEKGK